MIFIDTGAFVARYISRDQHHRAARMGWKELRKLKEPCLTSNFVLDETFTLLARRVSYSFSAERAHALYSSDALEILRPSHEDEVLAVNFFKKYADQAVSFTDSVSFVLMKKRNIRRAFTFDRHFLAAGFELWSGKQRGR